MIIYKATNQKNGKIYIGKTSLELDARIKQHLHSNLVFSKALKKYGLEFFEFVVIDYSNCNEELSNKERYWIKFYKTKGKNGYNMTDGGEGIPGWYFSMEVRKKLSDAHKGIPLSEEHRKSIGLAHLGKKESKESKRIMSITRKGIKKKPMLEETKKKISVAKKGILKTKETRKKMSFAKKGIRLPLRTEEHRKNQNIAMKRYWKIKKEVKNYA